MPIIMRKALIKGLPHYFFVRVCNKKQKTKLYRKSGTTR